ncbi:hypothetical protein GCM10009127_16510 [Alteraurantiacibacter aestuarii]|uniref:DUF1801 domain-containing protein n=1 Tax=Alteraurantiacibacter aestuarii TaxID=650004 RepID=A0A844ZJW5_9SPHN|nr:DUF1801 domain-containing protein [Alteraurantiacibacter aestuarii]MXO87763.1 DUF1801 domain-containing protein [Alteraurantiacibacter aestuarii]
MSTNKTQPTQTSADAFIAAVEHPGKREDAKVLDALFRNVTGVDPVMWGPTIIGYGSYHYRYDSGREGDICRVGFSPRKAKHSLYLLSCSAAGDEAPFAALREKMGKYSRGKGCLYVNKLADIDLAVLEQMIALSWNNSLERYPG